MNDVLDCVADVRKEVAPFIGIITAYGDQKAVGFSPKLPTWSTHGEPPNLSCTYIRAAFSDRFGFIFALGECRG